MIIFIILALLSIDATQCGCWGRFKSDPTPIIEINRGVSYVYKTVIEEDEVVIKERLATSRIKFLKERQITKLLSTLHPNAFPIFHSGNAERIVMSNIPGGDLYETIIKKLHFDIKHMMRTIFTGLKYMNDLDIAHRDIKPENVMIGPPIKLIDFGCATFFDRKLPRSQRMQGIEGTLFYMPPEMRKYRPYDESVDCFSAAVSILFVTLLKLKYFSMI